MQKHDKQTYSGAVSRKLIVWLSILVVIAGLAFGALSAVRYKHERARAAWKTATLARLAGLSLTNEDISHELATLKASRASEEHQAWTGEQVLLMTNDQYLVYAFRHGLNNGFLDHLFLARGSDGRWYYSTYHFCNMMAMARWDDPPGTIAEFAERYAVREFDGKPDECLNHTWPSKDGASIH